MLLIITNKYDPHVDFVLSRMYDEGLGERVVRLNTEDLLLGTRYAFDGREFQVEILDSGRKFRTGQVKAVWYRRPVPVLYKESGNRGLDEYVKKELETVLWGMYFAMGDALWINDPVKNRVASNKILQIKVAGEMGFSVPRTLITNDPQRVGDYFPDSSSLALKSISTASLYDTGRRDYVPLFTRRVSRDYVFGNADAVRNYGVFLQEFIEKEYDIRVVVLGREVFAFAIHSAEKEETKEDFRTLNPIQLKHEFIRLPSDVEDRVRRFVERFGLVFSSMDLLLSRDGKYYFIENNPNGQWLWLQDMTGVDLVGPFIDLFRHRI